jgi:hypothetical protein
MIGGSLVGLMLGFMMYTQNRNGGSVVRGWMEDSSNGLLTNGCYRCTVWIAGCLLQYSWFHLIDDDVEMNGNVDEEQKSLRQADIYSTLSTPTRASRDDSKTHHYRYSCQM